MINISPAFFLHNFSQEVNLTGIVKDNIAMLIL